jgi:hypothetical protein
MVFWNETPSSLVDWYKFFERMCCSPSAFYSEYGINAFLRNNHTASHPHLRRENLKSQLRLKHAPCQVWTWAVGFVQGRQHHRCNIIHHSRELLKRTATGTQRDSRFKVYRAIYAIIMKSVENVYRNNSEKRVAKLAPYYKKVSYPCNRPWRPIRLWDVEAPTFSRKLAHRWRSGCQPCALAALYPPGRFLVLISVRGWVDQRTIVWLEGLGQLKNPMTYRESNPRPDAKETVVVAERDRKANSWTRVDGISTCLVIISGVWIGNWIYWALTLITKNNYDILTELQNSKDHCNCSTHKVFSVSRSLVSASKDARSLTSKFPNCPRPQLPASYFSQL